MQVQLDHPDLDEGQTAAILEASYKISAKEAVQQADARGVVNAFIHSILGKSSLETLMNDEIHNHNDLNEKDPKVAWARIMSTTYQC